MHLDGRAYRNYGDADFEVTPNQLQRRPPNRTRLRARAVYA
ncbi:hypothetical protein ACGFY9_26920 [Streptomyces sp. NPDC048504]